MKLETIKISDISPSLSHSNAYITGYIIENSKEYSSDRKRKAVVICPGGGYSFTSDREGEPIALAFIKNDIQAFVLWYTTAPARYPQQLLELAAAMSYIKGHSDLYNITADEVAVCGFSAGGHLAASLGTMWNEPILRDTLKMSSDCFKPQAMILSYPVITSGEHAHHGSFDNLAGDDKDGTLREYLSLENRVTADTCPAFIWHTFNDATVPCENALLFASALKKYSVPFELVIYTHGPHGLSLCNASTARAGDSEFNNAHTAKWFDQCIEWWATLH